MSVPKPNIRNLLRNRVKWHMMPAVVLTIFTVTTYKLAYLDPKKRKIDEFNANYDLEADYKRMVKAGIFQTVRTDGTVTTEKFE